MGNKTPNEISQSQYFVIDTYFDDESIRNEEVLRVIYLFLKKAYKLSNKILNLFEQYFIWTYEADNKYFSESNFGEF